jgi:6-pyruvoyltetrahydropterin/6-carboxytetrahydropterin synthase
MGTHAITLRVPFSAGHRILGHKGKCKHLHGHNYVAVVVLHSELLDGIGMVADFGDVKMKVKGWIDTFWDHNMILNGADPLAALWAKGQSQGKCFEDDVFGGRAPFLMDMNPTAEAMAAVLFTVLKESYSGGGNESPHVKIAFVTIEETENCSATYMGAAP